MGQHTGEVLDQARAAAAARNQRSRELDIGAYVIPVAMFPDMRPMRTSSRRPRGAVCGRSAGRATTSSG